MNGTTFKRCGCRDQATGRLLGRACPKLRRPSGGWSPTHGVWHYQLELPPTPAGTRRQLRRGGFATQRHAADDLSHARALLAIGDRDDAHTRARLADLLLATTRHGRPLPDIEDVRRRLRVGVPLDKLPTVSEWLEEWLRGRRAVRANTLRGYATHIRRYFTPHLGHIRLDRLTIAHINDLFDAVDEHNQQIRAARTSPDPVIKNAVKGARLVGASTKQRIRATLRKALNDAIRAQLITTNPAAYVELPSGKRPKALVWTDARIARWKDTGQVPSPVMIWTPTQTGTFLDHATTDRLYALYHLIAYRGLRRGEACGVHWDDLDLASGTLTVRWQIVQLGWATHLTSPKTDDSTATIALDHTTITALQDHRERQETERLDAGTGWVDTGLVFTTEWGEPLHPSDVTDHFKTLTVEAGLPPIRLHDLRHGAATYALAAGVDMKIVQAMLRHSSITITADTYTTVLDDVARAAAEATAAHIPRNNRPMSEHNQSNSTVEAIRNDHETGESRTSTELSSIRDHGLTRNYAKIDKSITHCF